MNETYAETVAELTRLDPARFWELGAHNMPLVADAPFYIDPRFLEETNVPELAGAADAVYDWFSPVIEAIIDASRNDPVWKAATAKLCFKETKGVNLGVSKGGPGKGVGAKLAAAMIANINVFVKKGLRNPAVLGLLTVTLPGFGGDRISDTIIFVNEERFVAYSHRIYLRLGVKGEPHPKFKRYLLPRNPRTGFPIVLVPDEILRELKHDDLAYGDMFGDNNELRAYFDAKVRAVLGKDRLKANKNDYFRAFTDDKKHLRELAESFRKARPKPYDFVKDPYNHNLGDRAARYGASREPYPVPKDPESFEEVLLRICHDFKHGVEHEKLLYRADKAVRIPEVEIQNAFKSMARAIGRQIDVEVSAETNIGAGPVDFKFNCGSRLAGVVEFKVADNVSVVPGYKTQLPRYATAERAGVAAYVVVDFEDRTNLREQLEKLREEALKRGGAPLIVWVDAKPKPSASHDNGNA